MAHFNYGSGGGTTPPGGSNTQLQYNSSGAFGGSANLTFNANDDLILSAGSVGIQGEFDGFASGSGMAFDWVTGSNKIMCMGNDASTKGICIVHTMTSDLSGETPEAFKIYGDGLSVCNTGIVVKGGYSGSTLPNGSYGVMDYIPAGGPNRLRMVCFGNDATTRGQWGVYQAESDGGNGINSFVIDQSGNVAGATTYHTYSDERRKNNIVDLESMTAKLKQLRPVTFSWINPPSTGTNNNYGFIAQEVLPLFPDTILSVDLDPDIPGEELHVAYAAFVPIIVKVIQELEARIAALES